LPFLKRKKSNPRFWPRKTKHLEKEEKERLKEEKDRLDREEKERQEKKRKRAKEEKERRKHEEKEMERQAKLKKKEMENARKENIVGGKKRRLREHIRLRTGGAATKGILGGAAPMAGSGGRSSNASSRAKMTKSHSGTLDGLLLVPTVSPSPTGPPTTRSTEEPVPYSALGYQKTTTFPQQPQHLILTKMAPLPQSQLDARWERGMTGSMLHRFRNTSHEHASETQILAIE